LPPTVTSNELPVPSGFSTSNGLITDRTGTLYLRRPVTPARWRDTGPAGTRQAEAEGALGITRAAGPPVPRDVYLAVVRWQRPVVDVVIVCA
jgi:hypothetical protein